MIRISANLTTANLTTANLTMDNITELTALVRT
jgi:hypothetical protein